MLYRLITLSSLILSSLSANCCIDAPDENTCGDVATSPCMWIENNAAAMAASSNIPCVSESWYECEVVGNCPPPPPVPPVPKECVFNACANVIDEFNIAFVIDESGSVGSTNYHISLDFIEKMLENDINDISPISMLAYSSTTNMDVIYTFNQYGINGKQGALAALRSETYNGGMTATGTAMRQAVNEYIAQTQAHETNILFLMTDGHPNQGLATCDSTLLNDIQTAGIEVYIVGISSGFSKSAVQCLVQGNDGIINGGDTIDDYIISIPQFSKQLFYHIEAQLRRIVCPADVFVNNNNLFISDSRIINGVQNMIYYIVGLLLLICGGLIYYFREKICKKNEKYISLRDDNQSQYQSV
mmetsp:Transcript_60170/g.54160  ORF Transcript_60170/g.54160 Transcript_60170/m.54160 type:complete len:358 (-) Transcript_60170:274-1347(-)